MDFTPSEDQESVRELARGILENEVTPAGLKRAEAGELWFDRELWSKLAAANLLGVAVPEAQGGMGMGFVPLCVLLLELGRVVVPLPAVETLVGGLAVARFGSAAQKAAWLPRLAAGEAVFGAAWGGEETLGAVTAKSIEGGLVLEGTLAEVTHPDAARVLLVAQAERGPVGVLLDPELEGVEVIAARTSTGQPLAELGLHGVRVGADDVLGEPGADLSAWIRQHLLVGLCALQVGVSERALEITTQYVSEREQFGVPIGSFQAVQHRCADAFIDLEALRWCTWRAAWLLAEGRPAAREAAVAKFWAADAGARIGAASIHLHGGIGSDVDYPIHRHFLWSKAIELRGGSATPQLVRLGRDMARSGPEEHA